MSLAIFFTTTLGWLSNAFATIKPFIPGTLLVTCYTTIGHFGSYFASWWTARTYAKNCIGEGFSGFFNSYWTMGSATCMSFLVSHVSFTAIAVGCIMSTILLFIWFWYITFKSLLFPIAKNVKEEFNL